MKRLIYSPLMACLLIGATSQLDITQGLNNYSQMGLTSSILFPGLDQNTGVRVSQATQELNEKTALSLVWKLPQVQRKAREIERLSKRTIRVAAIVDGYPTPNEPYYKVQVFEKHPDENVTIYWFRVLKTNGVIEVLDLVNNQYISLEKWKPD
ncbi:hypothetical protein [aff. Roholtiella sp. LEGE 12411]|uniref:hypothetical protein n=1 Tax=aff. Roholtiella sp. LEGE 12411 TaxID=1828822 RepID=UPI00187F7B12|nr:hypothetical protein [aff. Roholtiella sp. LEGE 12411]MBE9038697.1 hypothetical protein [aff. Roholtiella sp. LEGE 12411]